MNANRPPFPERLEAARHLLGDLDRHRGEILDRLPGWWRDQAEAAASHAHGAYRQVAAVAALVEPDRWRNPQEVISPSSGERSIRLFAAAMGCAPCPHLRNGRAAPGVVVVDLNHRIAVCQRCTRTRRKPVDDQRCEICDEPVADNIFASFVAHLGSLVFMGHVGDSCCGWMAREEAA